ncbi:hypothetical protein J4Q44_G00214420 [Coregonus suidteri]|uniref:Uncharacterized protein n=1 Tax=Coregonus suidteri TaxID=861788 RepID=A0AAN8LQD9_9TELE
MHECVGAGHRSVTSYRSVELTLEMPDLSIIQHKGDLGKAWTSVENSLSCLPHHHRLCHYHRHAPPHHQSSSSLLEHLLCTVSASKLRGGWLLCDCEPLMPCPCAQKLHHTLNHDMLANYWWTFIYLRLFIHVFF